MHGLRRDTYVLTIRALSFGVLGDGERHPRMPLRRHRRQARPCVFLSIDVFFGARDGSLRRIQIRRRIFTRAGVVRRRDGLPSVAHFLHGSGRAADQAGDTNNHRD